MLMAFDAAHDASGARRDDLSSFVVPNDYARDIAARHPGRFEWIASVHPCRHDALEELTRAHAGGARAVKWLPPSMAIDLASPRCVPFYEALRRLDLPLITHAGEEQAVAGALHDHAGNPLHLRHPLEHGVRVVAAHCATLGESPDIDRVKDPAKAPVASSFELFSRLMAERRYEGLLFGDISAVTQVNRADYLGAILARREWAGRLLNGSDYPLPGILPLFSPARLVADGLLDERAVPALRSLRESNALLFDFVLKRNLRLAGEPLPASAFETRDFFDRGRSFHV
jgi:mannonate dehydratase